MTHPWPGRAMNGKYRSAVRLAAKGGPAARAADKEAYFGKLLKNIPGEATGLYLTLEGLALGLVAPAQQTLYLWFAFVAGLLMAPLYLWRISGEKSILRLGMAAFAYCVWVFAMGGVFARYSFYQPVVASIVLVVVAAFYPMIVKD